MMSGDDGSDSWSLGRAVYGSFRSRSGADSIFGSSHYRDSSHTSYGSGVIKRHNSFELLPPNMSGDERSDTLSVGSSAYGSFRSRSGADSDSVFSSSRSKVSSHSSGYGSLQSIPESVEQSETRRPLAVPKILKFFPKISKKNDKHEKDSKKT
ncbi:hypothetical protein Q8A67_000114 [Cirrhinus molitorella]|uniref:Uncharacterized protein n=1 Tax=Cirrhinus molitorella TaxID=172907 RepID=A0AA88QJ07_9TELE|nr:hypothetical protein Q8A67_000114 [Cirrhinus molitorella]